MSSGGSVTIADLDREDGSFHEHLHDFDGHHVAQQYLPDALVGSTFYEPADSGYEKQIRQRLEWWRRGKLDGR